MKQLTKMRNTSGNSLAEFAVVIALMATLMSTGQVKFSQAGEGGKGKKSGEEMAKIGKAANNFYNAVNDTEGAGRFPGQDKWDRNVPGGETPISGSAFNETGGTKGYKTLDDAIKVVESWDTYLDGETADHGKNWCSVFGQSLEIGDESYAIDGAHTSSIAGDDGDTHDMKTGETGQDQLGIGPDEFMAYMDPIKSPYLDGHFIYTVIGGTTLNSPSMIVTDFFAPKEDFIVVEP